MTESEADTVETVALPRSAVHLGRDREGADHYLKPGTGVAVVRHEAAGDTLEHTEALDGRPVQEWVDYVAARRGWTVCKYDDRPLDEWLVDALSKGAARADSHAEVTA